jgi:hypothetical protein
MRFPDRNEQKRHMQPVISSPGLQKREQRTKRNMVNDNSESILGMPGTPITFLLSMIGIFAWP